MSVYRALPPLCLMLFASSTMAGYGLNDVASGPESAGLAGADIALARDSFAINTNPAGLTQIDGQVVDLMVEPFVTLGRGHRDQIGNNSGIDNRLNLVVGGGYARRLPNDLVAGIGLFVQGGTGFTYDAFATPFGGRDQLSSVAGSIKLAPGLGWAINPQWRVGFAAGLLYSTADQKVFPSTSTPEFSGYRIDDLAGVSGNIKLGVQYRPTADWVLAATYTSKAPIRLQDGNARVNNTGSGGALVTYGDARLNGLAFAAELGLGARHQINPRWTLVGELTWVNWSSAMQSARLLARNPDDPAAAPTFAVDTPLDWRDQYLINLGVLYQWSGDTELRFGGNYGRNPVPDRTLSPLLALTPETTVAAGMSHQFTQQWQANATAVYQPPVRVHYDSPLTGPSSEETGVIVLYLSLSRRW